MPGPVAAFDVTPHVLVLTPGSSGTFEAKGASGISWSIVESGGGTIDAGGKYAAPTTPGVYHVVATSTADTSKTGTAVAVVGLVGPSRVTRWEPGVVGGIPARTTVCANIDAAAFGNGANDSAPAVQKAIDACPAGQVVTMSAGTFRWGSMVQLAKGITLRGAGSAQTSVKGGNGKPVGQGGMQYMQLGPSGEPQNAIASTLQSTTLLTADGQKGSNTIRVADGSGYKPGDLALISFRDDATIFPPPSNGGDFLLYVESGGARHSTGQMVSIAAVSGNTLTIDGVLHSTFTVARGAVIGRAPAVTKNAGVEGIHFVTPSQAIVGTFCEQCWITDVEADHGLGEGQISWWLSHRCEMRQNYVHHAQGYSQGGGSYGVTLNAYTSDTLVEDNAIYFFNKPFLFRASGGGNVVGYNYIDGGQDSAAPDWMEPDVDSHMVNSHMELVEGNLAGAMGGINTWGGMDGFTFFRNRVLGQHQDPALINVQFGNQAAFTLNAGMGNSNLLGNVVGLPGLALTAGPDKGKLAFYENVSEKDQPNGQITAGGYEATQYIALYRLGNGSQPGAFSSFDVDETPYPNVPKVAPTTIRHGNFDYVTSSVKWTASLPGQFLPDSMYRVSRPSFFGTGTWPWVDPLGSTKTAVLPAKQRFDAVQ